jgi:hypothetical protein
MKRCETWKTFILRSRSERTKLAPEGQRKEKVREGREAKGRNIHSKRETQKENRHTHRDNRCFQVSFKTG